MKEVISTTFSLARTGAKKSSRPFLVDVYNSLLCYTKISRVSWVWIQMQPRAQVWTDVFLTLPWLFFYVKMHKKLHIEHKSPLTNQVLSLKKREIQ